MSVETALPAAVQRSEDGGRLLVTTAAADGRPHMATAGSLRRIGTVGLEVTAWFCPRTVRNVAENPRMSVVDLSEGGQGFQLMCVVESVDEVATLNGWAPDLETDEPAPQVQRAFQTTVSEVLAFEDRVHTDDLL